MHHTFNGNFFISDSFERLRMVERPGSSTRRQWRPNPTEKLDRRCRGAGLLGACLAVRIIGNRACLCLHMVLAFR